MIETIDAIQLLKQSRVRTEEEQAWLEEHAREYEDLVYEEAEGRKQSWNDGSMIGSPNAWKGEL